MVLFALGRKVEVEDQSQLIQLLVWLFPGVVLVLVVWAELHMPPYWKGAASVKRGRAPLLILAFVKLLDFGVRPRMIIVDREGLLKGQQIAIAPCEFAALPIEIGAVSVVHQNRGAYRKVRSRRQFHAVLERGVRGRQSAISHGEYQRPLLRFIQVEGSDVLQ